MAIASYSRMPPGFRDGQGVHFVSADAKDLGSIATGACDRVRRRDLVGQITAVFIVGLSTLALGQDARVGGLLEQLKSPDAGVRARAAMSLSELGGAAKAAAPALAAALADRNLNVRYWSASALRGLGPDARQAVPALVAALKTFPGGSPELDGPARYYPDVRSVAAEALGAIGPLAKAAIPALKEATADQNADVRAAAAEALKRVAPR
jgi:HEAT repeat protein